MKISLSLKTNIKAIKEIIAVAKRKKTPEYLSFVHVDCVVVGTSRFVRLSATDLETTITHKLIDCDFVGDSSFSTLIHHEALSKLLPTYKTIDIIDDKIKAGQAEITHQVLDSTDYADILTDIQGIQGQEDAYALNDTDIIELRNALATALIASSNEESRVRLCSVFLSTNDQGFLVATATDGHRLTIYKTGIKTNLNALLPKGQVPLLCDVLNGNVDARIWATKSMLYVSRGQDFILAVRLIAEEFPDISRIVPKNNEYMITFNSAHLHSVKEALLFAQDKAGAGITLRHQKEGNKLYLSLKDSSTTGLTYESKDAGFAHIDYQISFSPKYLLDALQNTPIMLAGQSEFSPVLCTEETGKILNVLMARRG